MTQQVCNIITRSTRATRSTFAANRDTSQDNTAHTSTGKKYTLNINKTLKTKIEKCEEVSVECNVTAGGITGEMDTATFELFRSACTVLFTNIPPTRGRCVNNRVFDKHKRSFVQQTYFMLTEKRWDLPRTCTLPTIRCC